MNHAQRRSFGLWWKLEMSLAASTLYGVVSGNPVLIVCGIGAMAWLGWMLRKDWKEARGHDDWY